MEGIRETHQLGCIGVCILCIQFRAETWWGSERRQARKEG